MPFLNSGKGPTRWDTARVSYGRNGKRPEIVGHTIGTLSKIRSATTMFGPRGSRVTIGAQQLSFHPLLLRKLIRLPIGRQSG